MSAKKLNDPGDKAAIEARLRNLQPETMRHWGKMNAAQMVCHLTDSFRGVMGEKPAVLKRFSFWRLMRGIALYGPMKWPQGVKTRPEFEQGVGGTPPAEFEADLHALFAAIEKFTNSPRAFEFCPHPMFGKMTEKEWMRWAYLHCDHHLRQFGQ
ncbi:MAG TPA: DUF1569 domain-containing protein [Terracidiphilus sp.]|nr:DUF1569 domain-containing protein [Terracidiphilus sp.]